MRKVMSTYLNAVFGSRMNIILFMTGTPIIIRQCLVADLQ